MNCLFYLLNDISDCKSKQKKNTKTYFLLFFCRKHEKRTSDIRFPICDSRTSEIHFPNLKIVNLKSKILFCYFPTSTIKQQKAS